MEGKIIKALSGFYYVHAEGRLFECKAKGAFRNEAITPLVGDNVIIDIINDEECKGNVVDILPRKNSLIRPAVANVDQAMVVFAVRKPNPNLGILDRFLVLMKLQGIETIVVFNKKDLAKGNDIDELKAAYEKSGCQVFFVSAGTDEESLDEIKAQMNGKITVMAGPSGVGKSSILNALSQAGDEAIAQVGEISYKVGRGKHTTRHNEIFAINQNCYIVDTPGFTSLLVNENDVSVEDLAMYFPEFEKYAECCPFKDCSHIKERDCAVRQAADDGDISNSRYASYIAIYNELKSQQKY